MKRITWGNAATPLPAVLAEAGTLTREERQRIVRQALILIGENYAHLPLKRAMHSIDPVQRLKLLLQTLESGAEPEQPTEAEFHRQMTDIFMSLRDLHTNYLLPAPYDQLTAFLPFLVEDYVEDGRCRYAVSHVSRDFHHATFVPGVEICHWNGMTIERAVARNGERYAGLIIDVRGNGGGVIMNGELILQTLTPRRIEPEPLQFINTPRNLDICRSNGPQSSWADLSAWRESMAQALQTGAVFSAAIPVSDPEQCNAIGQKYFGPVVLITDALCYSTTDIFAAGFQDHEIGPILGTDGNTGAGGANVWEHRDFVNDILPHSVYEELPSGCGMRVSIRRTLRVGARAGTPVEDLGVIPQERHFLTRNDVLHGNKDLIRAAAALLAARRPRSLKVTIPSRTATHATVLVRVEGMTRIDLYLDDRPNGSFDVEEGRVQFDAPLTRTLELRGFDAAQLVARYRTNLG